MIDKFGRTIDYVRLSVTDRCNLRCLYCMPECGVEQLSHTQIMRFEEMLRLCRVLSGLGVVKFKVSGGEPLVRRGVCDFIRDLKQLPGVEQVTLTTNGVLLRQHLAELKQAGVDGINISLDTLNEFTYRELTRQGDIDSVLEGLQAAQAARICPLKLNVVLLKGKNDQELETLAALARDMELSVRFIELMPIGLGTVYEPVTGEEALARLTKAYGRPEQFDKPLGNGPAVYYSFPGFKGKIGLINAVSHAFCSSCNRVRLTSDGVLKLCLQYDIGADLLTPLRQGASDAELQRLIRQAVAQKPEKHVFDRESGQIDNREIKNMNAIGG
ncbi:MAG: GTP 3',8-cyclase MoaA [Firmicutes bacterium]|nr:GTP 3',8-cyclase MoaA [Bacillota bacterium]